MTRVRLTLIPLAATLALSACGSGTTVEGRPGGLVTAAPPAPVNVTPQLRTPTPRPTPTEQRVAIPGPEVSYRTPQGGGLLRVVTYSWQHTQVGEHAVPPKAMYLVLDVEITATDGTLELLPMNFKAVQGTATTDPTFGSDGNDPSLAHKTMKAGETVRGFVVYDLPQADTAITITDELGAKAGEVKIPRA